MKNWFSRSSAAAAVSGGLFLAAVLWAVAGRGTDWGVLALFGTAVAATVVLRPRPVVDPRMARLQVVVAEVAEGRIGSRITDIGDKDALGELCWHVNNMLDQLESCFREQQAVLQMAGEGRFFRKVQTAGLHGVFAESLRRNQASIDVLEANALAKAETERVERLAQEEIAGLIAAAARGDFGRRIDLAGREGFFRALAEDLNTLSATTESGLADVARVLRAIAGGDLGQRIDADYRGIFGELKSDANQTAESLGTVVREIQAAAGSIRCAAEEIAAGNQDLSRRTESQAASLEQTASSMAQLNSTVRHNADGAKQARELAEKARERVLRGGEGMNALVGTMGAIESSSSRIVDIVGVIESIAFQTNLLALNAAVEAARAGEQGRGFAVVATEVRTLAQKASASAKEIKALIEASQKSVAGGAAEVRRVGEMIAGVVDAFEALNRVVAEIADASGEQSMGIEQVATAVTTMEGVTQQNAALVEEAAAAAESLRDQVRGLDETTRRFRLGGPTGRGSRPAHAAAG